MDPMNDTGMNDPMEYREFKTSLPVHLLAKLSAHERYIIEELHKLEGQCNWITHVLLAHNKTLADLSKRQASSESWRSESAPRSDTHDKQLQEITAKLQALMEWKSAIVGKTGVLIWLVTIILPVVVRALVDWIGKK